MMIQLLKYEAPSRMPHLYFKNNHSFLCKSFLPCIWNFCSSPLSSCTVTGWHYGPNTFTCLRRGGPAGRTSCIKLLSFADKNSFGMLRQCAWRKKRSITNTLQLWLFLEVKLELLVMCSTCAQSRALHWDFFFLIQRFISDGAPPPSRSESIPSIYCTNMSLSQQIFFPRTTTGLHILKTVFKFN